MTFRPEFNASLKIKAAKENQITSDAGVLVTREVIEKTGLIPYLTERLHDPRDPCRIKHSLADLIMQLLIQLGQGYRACSKQLSEDPAFGAATSSQRGAGVAGPERQVASQPTMSRLLRMLSTEHNRAVLKDAVTKLSCEHIISRGGRQEVIFIDIDAMPLDAHGKQSGSEYHGYYKRRVYLPVFATVGETGDVLAVILRQGNKHEVTDCAGFVVSVEQIARRYLADMVCFRMDAGFNSGELYDDLETAGVNYLMRLRKNKRLVALTERYIEDRRSEDTWYDDIEYGADSWGCKRRIIVVVKPLPGKLINKLYYLVSNLPKETHPAEELAPMYPRRGNAERYQGEMHAACPLLLSSSPRPKSHYRNNPIERDDSTDAEGTEGQPVTKEEEKYAEIRPENDARLQVGMLVYELIHIAQQTEKGAPSENGAQVPCEENLPDPKEAASNESVMLEADTQETDNADSRAVEEEAASSESVMLEADTQETDSADSRAVEEEAASSESVMLEADTQETDNADSRAVEEEAASSESVMLEADTQETDSADSRAVEEDDKEMQIRTFRLEVLKVGALLVRHGRYVTFYIAHTAVAAWERFWTNFERFHWQTLPDL